ncbi:MAG: hypothetical protein JXB00_07850 [Bacteroidales bacterium]|nr:hypothetical protein [Bacteroidales bacterium]
MDLGINKYFGFLVANFKFQGPYSYQYVREYHTDYVKGNLIVKVVYEGDFWVSLILLKNPNPEIETGKLRVVDLDYSEIKSFQVEALDRKKKLWNSVSSSNFPDKSLWYFSKILRQNSELLDGNFGKFTMRFRILKMLGIK